MPLLRILNGLFAALFVYAAVVNLNDPDPVQWVAIYAAGAVATGWAAWHPGGLPWWSPLIVGAIAGIWAVTSTATSGFCSSTSRWPRSIPPVSLAPAAAACSAASFRMRSGMKTGRSDS